MALQTNLDRVTYDFATDMLINLGLPLFLAYFAMQIQSVSI